jgi:pentatricopeptide repeat protein
MAKKGDKRVDAFREEAMAFVTEHFDDMKKAFNAYISEGNWDKAVALYMKMADKVIPALPTQQADNGGMEKPDWQNKIDKLKKTMES